MNELVPRLSVAFQTDKTLAQYRELAALAESYGFGTVSVYGDLLFQPPLPALLAMAEATQHVRLGPACLNPFTTHPVEIAGQMAVLNTVSKGRAYLGLTRGAWLDSVGVTPKRPIAAMREAVALIRQLLSGQQAELPGGTFRLAAHHRLNYAYDGGDVPLLIGTWGERMAELAGELAGEVKVGGSANPAMVGVMQKRLAPGITLGGRAADAVGIVLGAVTVVDTDREAARARARREVALYLPVVAPFDPAANFEPELLGRIARAVEDGQLDAAAGLISDEMLDMFAFAGTPGEVIEQVQRIFAAGAARVEFGTPLGLTPGDGLKLLGERVLPHFRG